MQDLLKLEDFQPRVGETFATMPADGSTVALTLVEATALTAQRYPNASRAPFNLFFAGPASTALGQATWELSNETMGTLPIFIVPIRLEGDRLIYQAVFT